MFHPMHSRGATHGARVDIERLCKFHYAPAGDLLTTKRWSVHEFNHALRVRP